MSHSPDTSPVDVDSDASCALIKQLVEIESYSGAETEAVNFLVEQMKQRSFDRAYVDSAGSAIGIRGSDAPRATMVLLGHIDTVPGKIPVRIEGRKLYGRGSVDAKGPLAASVLAASAATVPPDIQLVVAGAVEEESATSKGARQVAQEFAADYCIIGEPSGAGAITLGYKGRVLIDYEISVDEGHSAGPSTTAAESASQFWQSIQQYSERFNTDRQRLFDQLLPSLRSINSTSDGLTSRATAKIGCRLPLSFDIDSFRAFIESQAGDATIDTLGYEVAYSSDRSNPLVRALAHAIRSHGQRPVYKQKTGTCDMNVVAPIWCCPIIAYGPGNSSLDHTPHEHLDLDEFLLSVRILKSAIESLATSI